MRPPPFPIKIARKMVCTKRNSTKKIQTVYSQPSSLIWPLLSFSLRHFICVAFIYTSHVFVFNAVRVIFSLCPFGEMDCWGESLNCRWKGQSIDSKYEVYPNPILIESFSSVKFSTHWFLRSQPTTPAMFTNQMW